MGADIHSDISISVLFLVVETIIVSNNSFQNNSRLKKLKVKKLKNYLLLPEKHAATWN